MIVLQMWHTWQKFPESGPVLTLGRTLAKRAAGQKRYDKNQSGVQDVRSASAYHAGLSSAGRSI